MDEFFQIIEKNGLKLTIPSHSAACSNSLWTRENVWLRSKVETTSGELVSQGWGKFHNLGQGPDGLRIDLEDIVKAIERQDAVATLKYDGSALYFSSSGDTRIIRTRGSLGYEHLENANEIDNLRLKYPLIFNPSYMKGFTLLCEFCSPTNQIVIKYSEPKLVLTGGVSHLTMRYLTIAQLEVISAETEVPLTENFLLNKDGWTKLYAKMEIDKEIEGYVIRLQREQRLVKIKTQSYFTKHALRSNLNTDRLADLWFQYSCPNFTDFINIFKAQYDEEIAMWALPVISNLMDGVREYLSIMEALKVKYELNKHLSRKDFAILMQSQYGATKKFGVMMNFYTGKETTKETLKHILLQNTRQVELGMFGKKRELDAEEE